MNRQRPSRIPSDISLNMLNDHERQFQQLSQAAQVPVPFLERLFPRLRASTRPSMFLLARAQPLKNEYHDNEHVHGPDQAADPSRGTGNARLVIGLMWSLAVSAVLWVIVFRIIHGLT